MRAAKVLFTHHGINGVTTQQVADEADVAIGTLFLYASTKAELLIMVQNTKFAAAIDDGLTAARAAAPSTDARHDAVGTAMALLRPVVVCIREHPDNGRTYLHELVFGDPGEAHRAEGLALAARLEAGIASILDRTEPDITPERAALLARVITAIVHITTTASVFSELDDETILSDIRRQIRASVDSTSPSATQHPIERPQP